MYNTIKRVITVLFIVFLLFVFIVPHHYLNKSCDAFLALIDEAEADDPGEALEELDKLYRERSKALLGFLTHEEVDALGAAIAAAVPLRDEEALKSALAGLREGVEALRHVETFSWEAVC